MTSLCAQLSLMSGVGGHRNETPVSGNKTFFKGGCARSDEGPLQGGGFMISITRYLHHYNSQNNVELSSSAVIASR